MFADLYLRLAYAIGGPVLSDAPRRRCCAFMAPFEPSKSTHFLPTAIRETSRIGRRAVPQHFAFAIKRAATLPPTRGCAARGAVERLLKRAATSRAARVVLLQLASLSAVWQFRRPREPCCVRRPRVRSRWGGGGGRAAPPVLVELRGAHPSRIARRGTVLGLTKLPAPHASPATASWAYFYYNAVPSPPAVVLRTASIVTVDRRLIAFAVAHRRLRLLTMMLTRCATARRRNIQRLVEARRVCQLVLAGRCTRGCNPMTKGNRMPGTKAQ